MFELLKRLSDSLARAGSAMLFGGSVSLLVAVALAKGLVSLSDYESDDFSWLSDVDVDELTTFDTP